MPEKHTNTEPFNKCSVALTKNRLPLKWQHQEMNGIIKGSSVEMESLSSSLSLAMYLSLTHLLTYRMQCTILRVNQFVPEVKPLRPIKTEWVTLMNNSGGSIDINMTYSKLEQHSTELLNTKWLVLPSVCLMWSISLFRRETASKLLRSVTEYIIRNPSPHLMELSREDAAGPTHS